MSKSRTSIAPLQWQLWHIFLLTFLIGSAIAVGRVAGPFVSVLLVGLAVVVVLLGLLKCENLVFAGWAGAAISIAVLLLILLAFQVDVIVRFGCLVAYPVFGYSVGILDAASRTIRSGI